MDSDEGEEGKKQKKKKKKRWNIWEIRGETESKVPDVSTFYSRFLAHLVN